MPPNQYGCHRNRHRPHSPHGTLGAESRRSPLDRRDSAPRGEPRRLPGACLRRRPLNVSAPPSTCVTWPGGALCWSGPREVRWTDTGTHTPANLIYASGVPVGDDPGAGAAGGRMHGAVRGGSGPNAMTTRSRFARSSMLACSRRVSAGAVTAIGPAQRVGAIAPDRRDSAPRVKPPRLPGACLVRSRVDTELQQLSLTPAKEASGGGGVS